MIRPRPTTLLRAIPRSTLTPNPTALRIRHASHSAYKNQTTNGLVMGSLGVVGLLGWTAVFVKMSEKSKSSHKKSSKHDSHAPTIVAEKATEAEATTEDPTSADQNNSSSAAYDPVTGEINWDCPCLGGMATGPCGEEFKAAFSCFIYSEDEPKGVDCVDKFRGMQTCFRKYPEIYGNDDEEDEDDEATLIQAAEAALALSD